MPIDEQAENEAKEELLRIKEEWKKRVDLIRETQVSRREARSYRMHIWQVKLNFRDKYLPDISLDLFHESMTAIEAIATDVSIALRKGQENYEMERKRWWIEIIKALGGGIIFWAIVFLVFKYLLNIEIPLYR